MCVYAGDTPDKLAACLDSLTAQTRMPDEIVIVKDGPLTAPLDEVIARTASRYPGLLGVQALETNAGLIEASTRAWAIAAANSCSAWMPTTLPGPTASNGSVRSCRRTRR